jgi:biopolymer transport protein ExbB
MNDHSRPLLPATLQGLLLSICLLAMPIQAEPTAPQVTAIEQPATALALPDNHPVLDQHDLSPLGMYQQADVLVKGVMIGLLLASVLTWTIWLAKSIELVSARRRLFRGIAALSAAHTLQDAQRLMPQGSVAHELLLDAQAELKISGSARAAEGIRERVSFRLERLVAANGRQMSRGTGVLASIGATAPFVGLFGTVWGIMNSFIGIAQAQTSNLAVVAPGIAEALLATAMGLIAAIPAVLIYNLFARAIGTYKAMVGDAAAQVLLLVSRDLDPPMAGKTQPLPRAACA